MSLKQQIADWHANPPEWASHFTARDWDNAELIAEELEAATGGENVSCTEAEEGFYCTLEQGHSGTCVVYLDC